MILSFHSLAFRFQKFALLKRSINPNGRYNTIRTYARIHKDQSLWWIFRVHLMFCTFFFSLITFRIFFRFFSSSTRMKYRSTRSDLCYLWSSSRYDSFPDIEFLSKFSSPSRFLSSFLFFFNSRVNYLQL